MRLTTLALILAIIGAFQVFAAAYILTGGGPEKSTLFYAYYLFNKAFVFFHLGYASAMGDVLVVAIMLILSVYLVHQFRQGKEAKR